MDERYDMSRAVRDQKYRYIHNYIPYRVYGQPLEYLWRAPSIGSWEQAYLAGECNEIQSAFWQTKPVEELYDTENDPWEVNNLAADPEYKEVLARMRKANNDWVKSIKDCGFIPESEMVKLSGDMPRYDYMRSAEVDMDVLVDAADLATMATGEDLPVLKEYLGSENSAIRYWGATGLLIMGDKAMPLKNELLKLLDDSSINVKVVAAEALYGLGEQNVAIETLSEVILEGDQFGSTHALNAVDCLEIEGGVMKDALQEMMDTYQDYNNRNYDLRAVGMLLKKWNMELEGHMDKFAY